MTAKRLSASAVPAYVSGALVGMCTVSLRSTTEKKLRAGELTQFSVVQIFSPEWRAGGYSVHKSQNRLENRISKLKFHFSFSNDGFTRLCIVAMSRTYFLLALGTYLLLTHTAI